MIMRGADCAETCDLLLGTVQANIKPGFIHHLVSYTVTGSRETGYGIMRMSRTVGRIASFEN